MLSEKKKRLLGGHVGTRICDHKSKGRRDPDRVCLTGAEGARKESSVETQQRA